MSNPVSFRQYTGTAAENYERYFVPAVAAPVAEDLLRAADLGIGERVLDVACGTGIIARLATERVGSSGKVVGVDVAPDMIEVARSTVMPSGLPIEWRRADAATLPFTDDAFDVVLCQMGLMLFQDRAATLAEMHRVVTSDGRVALNTPGTINRPMEILADGLAKHINPDLAGFVHAIFSMDDPTTHVRLLAEAGFQDVEATVVATTLRLPPPQEFVWQYINLTPLGAFVNQAPEAAKAALDADVVDQWQRFLDRNPAPLEQAMVIATGRA